MRIDIYKGWKDISKEIIIGKERSYRTKNILITVGKFLFF